MIIGIDLGTTNSVAAYLTDGGPKLIPNALGEVLTPSVVGVDLNGNVVVGRAAKELQVVHPDRCAATFKRCMGTDWKCQLGGKDFTPEKLSALVLKSLKADAEALFGHPVDRAVITVPAYFNDHQRKATLNAGRIAGFEVKRIINEPTAAAIAYGFHEANVESLLAVIDLGGGTFDVSIIEKFEGSLEVRASSGESFLGGKDFTRSICARLLESKGMHLERAEMESPHLVSRLLHQCERAKCGLTRELTTEIRFPNAKGELSADSETTSIHREQLIQWCEPILARIELPIRRALGDARIRPHDLHEVILVGGATRMPMVAARVEEMLEKTPVCRLNPDEVVALGAAIVGGLIAGDKVVDDLVVVDVAPFTLGIEISKRLGMQERNGYFLPIINRNSTIPASRVERVQTTHSNQTRCKVTVYQGESRRVEQNHFLGEFMIDGIPPGPAGQPVDVRFTYDLNGILEVEATIVTTGHCIQHLITNHASGLTEAEIQQAVSSMQKLKSHPRIETINQLLLHRAERIYQELPQQERLMLSELLDGFEGALESGDPEQIKQFRESLNSFLQRFDHGGGESEADSTDPDHE